MPQVIKKDLKAFDQTLRATKSIKKAMIAAGYSEKVAHQGLAKLPKAAMKLVSANAKKLMLIADAIDADGQARLVRGHLVQNVLSGEDKAVRSAELLGKDKRVNMFTADVQVGIINVAPPQALVDAILNHAKTLSAHSLGTTPKEQPTHLIDNNDPPSE